MDVDYPSDMAQLPHIDTHAQHVAATPREVWAALLRKGQRVADQRTARLPARILATEPRARHGEWRTRDPQPGDAIPGFVVRESVPRQRLVLDGRHRFSTYTLTFTLEPSGGGTTVTADTHAAFPGVAGQLYKTMVIRSHAHSVLVRRLLRTLAG